ncbi:MAG: GNAT family N-acetyltransferase [Vulcanimicrobiota bacterium]
MGAMIVCWLRNGRRVLVRPLDADDKPTIQAGFERLSARSRYNRFLRAVKHLSADDLELLTRVDQKDHVALLALDHHHGVGVARLIRLPDQPQLAEFAITVVDSHQGLGLGKLLLQFLAYSALARGVTTLRGWVHPENHAMRHLLLQAGARLTASEPGLHCLDMALLG